MGNEPNLNISVWALVFVASDHTKYGVLIVRTGTMSCRRMYITSKYIEKHE